MDAGTVSGSPLMFYQRTKWGRAKKTVVDGTKYDSKFEAGEARDLALQAKAGKIAGFEAHVRIPLEVNGFHVSDYYIDFVVHHLDGTTEYIETKGLPTAVWVLKWKIFDATYGQLPNVKLTLVQQKQFKIRRIRKA
jgi:hypothetical protein